MCSTQVVLKNQRTFARKTSLLFYSILNTVPFKVVPSIGKTEKIAICCQNLPLGALSSRSALCWLARYLKSSVSFWTRLVYWTVINEYSRMNDTIELMLLAHKGLWMNCLDYVYIQVYWHKAFSQESTLFKNLIYCKSNAPHTTTTRMRLIRTSPHLPASLVCAIGVVHGVP